MTTIRPATLNDLAAVVDLANGLAQEDAGAYGIATNLGWARQEGETSFTRTITSDTGVVLLAEVDGIAVGSLTGAVHAPSAWRTVRVAEIVALYVRPEHRSRCVGEDLVRRYRAWAAEAGAERLSVSAFAANARAIAFYERVGFAPYELVLEQAIAAEAAPTAVPAAGSRSAG